MTMQDHPLPHQQQANLTDVPETTLWTLHNRATESKRPDGIINDPDAEKIFAAIDYPYRETFGAPSASHGLRSITFDKHLKAFLQQHPRANVVNLGEGLETQRFRIGENNARWYSVDLAETIQLREKFIAPDDQHQHIAYSALDQRWLERVSGSTPTFITAQGLFMYFDESDVQTLLQAIHQHFDHYVLMFDTIPVWFSNKAMSAKGLRMSKRYVAPKMPWGIDRNNIKERLHSWLDSESKPTNEISDIGYPLFPRGIERFFSLAWRRIPAMGKRAPTIVKIEASNKKPAIG
ncbi:MAG: class I SAM-dependent methyltransferase [Pseudomonadota bacterium]